MPLTSSSAPAASIESEILPGTLVQSIDQNRIIVLCTGEGAWYSSFRGVVVHVPEIASITPKLGSESPIWARCSFKPFKGTVSLTQ